MKKSNMKILLILLFLFSLNLFGAISDKVIRQNIQNEQQKKVYEEQKKDSDLKNNKTYDMKLIEVNEDAKEDDCIEIEKINIKNATIFDEDDFEDIIEPYLNNCNGFKNLSNLRDKISNKYIDEGYVTSRAYFKPQDLTDGIIDIDILEGKIEKIENVDVKTGNLYSAYENRVLNLKDLEVAIQQAQRLRSQKVDFQLIPGSKVGYTVIKIIGKKIAEPHYGNIGINNFGTKKTGTYQISTNFNYENPLNINDIVNLNLNSTDNAFKGNNNTLGSSLSYSFPFERFLFNFDYTYSNYKQLNKDEFGDSFQSNGNTNGFLIGTNYKLFHNKNHSIDIISSIENKKSTNFLNNVQLELQSYSLNAVGLGAKHSYVGDSYDYYSKFMIYQGLGGSGASFARQETDYLKYVLDLNYNKYFETSNNLKFSTNLRSQFSSNYLFGTEEISMGGIYSVRGFNNTGLSGNTGFYQQNQFSFECLINNIKVSPYIGLDIGYVQENENNIFGNIVGGAIGTRWIFIKDLNMDLFYCVPLKDSEFTKEDSETFLGLSLIYNY